MNDGMEAMAKQQNIIKAITNYGKQLFGFIRSRVTSDEDAEDILQDVWYQLSSQPELEAIESVSGWLYRVAKNKIVDRSRKKKTDLLDDYGTADEEGDFHLPEFLASDTLNPETEHLKQLFWEELFVALDELPLNQRNVFVWNEMEDMTLQEIATKENENIKTIISRKRYAVQHLRNRMEYLYNEIIHY